MARAKRSNLSRTGTTNTTHQVAEFYHHVVSSITRGQVATNGHQELGDVYNDKLALGVEVKSSDNRHSWRISISQLNKHARSIPFPLSSYLYAICSYRSNGWFKRGEKKPRGVKATTYSMMARLTSKNERHEFLAKRTDELYLLDIKIIHALARRHGTITGAFAGKPEKALKLNRDILRQLHKSSDLFFFSINLNPHQFVIESRNVVVPVTIDDCKYVSQFTLVSVMRKSWYKKITAVLQAETLVA
jgi:hypothetical protein